MDFYVLYASILKKQDIKIMKKNIFANAIFAAVAFASFSALAEETGDLSAEQKAANSNKLVACIAEKATKAFQDAAQKNKTELRRLSREEAFAMGAEEYMRLAEPVFKKEIPDLKAEYDQCTADALNIKREEVPPSGKYIVTRTPSGDISSVRLDLEQEAIRSEFMERNFDHLSVDRGLRAMGDEIGRKVLDVIYNNAQP